MQSCRLNIATLLTAVAKLGYLRAETSCIATYGGNGNGANCVFPYTYDGIDYSRCITEDKYGNAFNAWCSTVSNYNLQTDESWGHCIIPTYGGTGNLSKYHI